jgi:hypothetical protein
LRLSDPHRFLQPPFPSFDSCKFRQLPKDRKLIIRRLRNPSSNEKIGQSRSIQGRYFAIFALSSRCSKSLTFCSKDAR